jgi:hypothetical protein
MRITWFSAPYALPGRAWSFPYSTPAEARWRAYLNVGAERSSGTIERRLNSDLSAPHSNQAGLAAHA